MLEIVPRPGVEYTRYGSRDESCAIRGDRQTQFVCRGASMLNAKTRRLWQFLFLGALTCALLSAQMTVTGTIAGTVIDPSGQAIAGAKVSATNASTSEPRTVTANEVGAFSL